LPEKIARFVEKYEFFPGDELDDLEQFLLLALELDLNGF
jgi:hypothetical protein